MITLSIILCLLCVIAITHGFYSNSLMTRPGSQVIFLRNSVPFGQNYSKAVESHVCCLDYIITRLSIVTILLQLKYSQSFFVEIGRVFFSIGYRLPQRLNPTLLPLIHDYDLVTRFYFLYGIDLLA